ncbi:MAG: ARMT1-like domain-containing protein [Dehalococcoidia bacterium]
MKIADECYSCLGRLVRQAAELGTEDPELRARAIEAGLKFLEEEFSSDKTSIAVATPLHRIVREITGNPDPYLKMKGTEVETARHLYRNWDSSSRPSLRDDIELAVRGNTIDFFRTLDEIKRDLALPVNFAIDDIPKLEAKLKEAKKILYLADNAGEVFFDLRLVRRMSEYGTVTYVVKESPVQNDVCLEDVDRFGLAELLPRVISTGTDTPGVDMEQASPEFKSEFEAADLILAKGMGYWETLSELPAQGKVFHLLKAKCPPVAASLNVPVDSYVAFLR